MKNIKFPDHNIIRKKDMIKLSPKIPDRRNGDIIINKGDSVQMVKDQRSLIPLTVCVIWDYKKKGWRLHESCASKGMLKQ